MVAIPKDVKMCQYQKSVNKCILIFNDFYSKTRENSYDLKNIAVLTFC